MRQARPELNRRSKRWTKRRGATLVEAAVVVPALLVLTLGLVQFGLVYNAMLTLNNLAREGARFAAVRAQDAGDTPAGRDKLLQQVSAYLLQRAKGTAVDMRSPSTVSLRIDAPSLKSNSPVRVVIRYNMIANKAFIPNLLPLPASLANYEASAVNLIE